MSIFTVSSMFVAPPLALIVAAVLAQAAGGTGSVVFDKMIEASPIGAACVIIVLAFLKHLKTEGDRTAKLDESRLKEWERVGDACHTHQREQASAYKQVVDSNTLALSENTKVLADLRRRRG